jgi:branched-chain amino acid aminotransferase
MSMEDRDGLIWLDGRLAPWRDARVHILSYTFQHGAGFFEGVRVYNGELGPAAFRLEEHTERFLASAKILQMEVPFTQAELVAAQIQVVAANQLDECYLRPVGFYDGKVVGVSAVGNDVHVAIAAWPWADYLGADAREKGIRVKTSSYSRHHVNAVMGKAKATGHYINSMLAVAEAKQQGFNDALMLDVHGYVAECSTSNVFLVRKGRLSTPDKTAVLEGITRATIIELAERAGIRVDERRITRDELYTADEVFLTGTAAEVTSIVELDNRTIGDGRPGLITRQLQEAYYLAATGKDAASHAWLSPVAMPTRA